MVHEMDPQLANGPPSGEGGEAVVAAGVCDNQITRPFKALPPVTEIDFTDVAAIGLAEQNVPGDAGVATGPVDAHT
jgi:hypothetical protein